MKHLSGIEVMTYGLLKQPGRQLLSVIADSEASDASDAHPVNTMPDETENKLSKQIAKLLDEKAGELDIPASLLATRRDLMAMVQGSRSLDVLHGWRGEIIGDKLLEQLEKNA